MTYTPGDIFRAMGRNWVCEDEFRYSLNPNNRYSTLSVATMQREWEWRTRTLDICVEQCQTNGLRVPKQRAKFMLRNTPQELEAALFRAREEENRMRLRVRRHSLAADARMFAEDGDILQARQFHQWSISPDIQSDCDMSDED